VAGSRSGVAVCLGVLLLVIGRAARYQITTGEIGDAALGVQLCIVAQHLSLI